MLDVICSSGACCGAESDGKALSDVRLVDSDFRFNLCIASASAFVAIAIAGAVATVATWRLVVGVVVLRAAIARLFTAIVIRIFSRFAFFWIAIARRNVRMRVRSWFPFTPVRVRV